MVKTKYTEQQAIDEVVRTTEAILTTQDDDKCVDAIRAHIQLLLDQGKYSDKTVNEVADVDIILVDSIEAMYQKADELGIKDPTHFNHCQELRWQRVYEAGEMLGAKYDQHIYETYSNLIKEAYAYIVGDRETLDETPTWVVSRKPVAVRLETDSQGAKQPHAVAEPAIEYRDGTGYYFHHGIQIPEKMGRLKPEDWDAKWVLEATRSDMRALIVAGIGPAKFVEGLGAKLVDEKSFDGVHAVEGPFTETIKLFEPDWDGIQFYPATLFKVLNVKCPSTKQDHWHWVTYDCNTVEEAYSCHWPGMRPGDWGFVA